VISSSIDRSKDVATALLLFKSQSLPIADDREHSHDLQCRLIGTLYKLLGIQAGFCALETQSNLTYLEVIDDHHISMAPP